MLAGASVLAKRSVSLLSTVVAAPLLRPAAPLAPLALSTLDVTARSSHALSAHRHGDPDNSPDTPFDFTEENHRTAERILGKYPGNYRQSAIIPLLDIAQRQNGNFLSIAAMDKVAKIVGCEPIRVYEVASFYTMFNRERVGKYFIQLCGTTPCMVCGAQEIKNTIEEHLNIKDGETTADGLFTLLEVECLGACANAPMVQINDDFIECLTPETTKEVLDLYKAGKPPKMTKWGSLPMNGQLSCEGPQGKTSLKTVPKPPPCRELKGEVDPATVKKHMGY